MESGYDGGEMKPWEGETWEATGDHRVLFGKGAAGRVQGEAYAVDVFQRQIDPQAMDQRVKLMACAPEAIRLLLEAEWHDSYEERVCMFDGCYPPYDDPPQPGRGGHKPDCRWLAVMRKAGVRV